MTIKRFLLFFSVFNALLAIAPLIAGVGKPGILIPGFWKVFVLFGLFTVLIFFTARWRMAISNKASGQIILATITVRLLFCMVLVLVYISQNNPDPVGFVCWFFYLYFFHTVFEIYAMFRNLRNQNFK